MREEIDILNAVANEVMTSLIINDLAKEVSVTDKDYMADVLIVSSKNLTYKFFIGIDEAILKLFFIPPLNQNRHGGVVTKLYQWQLADPDCVAKLLNTISYFIK